MRAVLDKGAVDRSWLTAHTVGWEALETRLAEWPVARAAEICGLDEAVVRTLGNRLAATRPTAIRIGLGLQRHGGGGAAIRAITAIPALTGDWRHVGGGALCMTEGHYPVDVAGVAFPDDLPMPPGRTVNMSRLGEALTGLDDPPVKALVVFDANPAAAAPNAGRIREGLSRDDLFTAVIEQRRTDTSDFADILLPATMQPEHADLHGSYGHLYLTWNEPAVEPPGECLTNTEIFRRLAAALGLSHPRFHDSDMDLARQLLDSPELRARGLTLEALREEGYVRIASFERGIAPFAEGGFSTPSGKVELWSDSLAAEGHDPLVGYVPSHEAADGDLADRYPLVLIAPASRFFVNSTFASLPWHRLKAGASLVTMHPDDATAREIETGDEIRIWNDRGAFSAAAVVDDSVRPGVAFTYKVQWSKFSPGGSNVNATTPERDADLGGSPTFHDNRVEISKVLRKEGRAAADQAAKAHRGRQPASTGLLVSVVEREPTSVA